MCHEAAALNCGVERGEDNRALVYVHSSEDDGHGRSPQDCRQGRRLVQEPLPILPAPLPETREPPRLIEPEAALAPHEQHPMKLLRLPGRAWSPPAPSAPVLHLLDSLADPSRCSAA